MAKSRVRSTLMGLGFLVSIIFVSAWWLLGIRQAPAPELSGALTSESLSWESRIRTYQVYRPSRVLRSPPIVFVLHGSMGNGVMARMSMAQEFDRLADEEGFLVVYPDGFDDHWNGCRAAGPYAANQLDVDDVGFFRAIVGRLVTEDLADPEAVFATGISNGGHMAIRLALEAPDLVRAVAPIVASMPSDDNLACEDRGAGVAFLLINGTEDPMNPYEGGDVALFGVVGNRGGVRSTPATIQMFAERAGYGGAPDVSNLPDVEPDDGSHLVRYQWAEEGRPEVTLLAIVGGGHSVPHPVQRGPRLLGRTNADIHTAEVVWAFFSRNLK
jgi:polyhydroxybutyrate depolymerase